MFRKISSISLLMSVLFLLTTIFPSSLFSYEIVNSQDSKLETVDESLGYKSVTFKKVRCPQCGMEFYYVPGKESPHSHWVQYEIPNEVSGGADLNSERKIKGNTLRQEEEMVLDLFAQEKNSEREIDETSKERELPFSQVEKKRFKEYELRQKLSCPYDGYDFFPEGDVIEERKLMRDFLYMESLSSIESSFTKSIPFGISKDLKQFGYSLFVSKGDAREQEEESSFLEESTEALTTLGMLKAAFTPASSQSIFSVQDATSQLAVVPIGPDYIIGPGDTLVINIWGSVQETFPVEVDREGKIMLPKAGPLYLWGVSFQEAETRIRERLNQFYTNFNVDVSMGKIRNIQVFVMGEVKEPGSYAINSQSTIFNALYAAGGPTKLGSLRKIKLIHGDQDKEEIDLYPFLLEGENLKYSKIQSGDTIFVPSIGDVVAIAGNVKRPAIYETRSEISMTDLLTFAGGITPTGDLERLQVERVRNNERRVMLDMKLKRTDVGRFSLEDINMKNGDLVIVSPIVRLKHDFVSILGNVERPADYALSEDMKVSDLIDRAKGFMPGTYLYRAEIARVAKDRTREIIPVSLDKLMLGEQEDVLLNEWDILLVYSEAEVQPPSFVEIDGAVNKPGRYELTSNMKVSDLIFKAAGVKSGEVIRGAELFHVMPGEQPVIREISIKQFSGSINVSLDKDIILRAGDALFVKSEPKLTKRTIAKIEGEVRFPGEYSIREGERLSSFLERAGGITKEAFLDGTIFTRESIRKSQERMRRKFLERESKTLLEEQQSILLRGSTSGIVARSAESLRAREGMLDFIRDIEIQGRMVIKMLPISKLKGTKYDILLEDGDKIFIPQIPASVSIIGSVNNSISVPFERGKGVQYYIRRSGGLTRHADKSGIYVLRANGEAVSKFTMSRSVRRGDTIVVPQELKAWTPPGTLLKDTVEILSRIAVGVGIIAALN